MAGWKFTLFNRKYIDSNGGFSIAMLVCRRVYVGNIHASFPMAYPWDPVGGESSEVRSCKRMCCSMQLWVLKLGALDLRFQLGLSFNKSGRWGISAKCPKGGCGCLWWLFVVVVVVVVVVVIINKFYSPQKWRDMMGNDQTEWLS